MRKSFRIVRVKFDIAKIIVIISCKGHSDSYYILW